MSGALGRVSTWEAQIALSAVLEHKEELQSIELFRVQMVTVSSSQFINLLCAPLTIANLKQTIQIVVGDSKTKGTWRDFDILEKVRRWTVNDHALKLEIFSQVMNWVRLPEFLFREEHTKKELICLPKALISSISIPVRLWEKNTLSGPMTQQVWGYFLERIDDKILIIKLNYFN